MQYNGIELKEITEPQICNPPKKMLVWSSIYNEPLIAEVSAVVCREDGLVAMCYNGECFPCCAEIPEEPKPRRATWKELAYWLIDGKGLVVDEIIGKIDTGVMFIKEDIDAEVSDHLKVMRRDDTEWHEPNADYLGLE